MQTDEINESHSILLGYCFWLLGFFGLHRFYYGRKISGLIYACTFGLLLIGWIVDLFLIPSMNTDANKLYEEGEYNYSIAWILLVLLGVFGIHRFYLGKWISGLIWLFTGGLVGIGVLYDIATLNEKVHNLNI